MKKVVVTEMLLHNRIEINDVQLADICRQFRVRELALFGSALRDDYGVDSDIDVLVEYEPDARVGLFHHYKLEEALRQFFGRDIDLISKRGLRPILRDEVLGTAEIIYAT